MARRHRGSAPRTATDRRPARRACLALEGEAQALADRLPDLAARGAARRQYGRARHPRSPPRRHRRDLLAVPPVQPGERRRHASSTGGARPVRPSLRARARMGGGTHLLALAGCIALDGRSAVIWRRPRKRDRAVVLTLALRRAAGAGRRAHRPDGRDAAADRAARHSARIAEALATHEADPASAGQPAAGGTPRAASRPRCCSAISSIRRRPIAAAHQRAGRRRRQRPSRPDPRSGRGDAGLTRGAWSSARPKAASAGSPTASRHCAPPIRRSSPRIRAEITRGGEPGRLVVPGASHRPAGRRAAAGARSCACRDWPATIAGGRKSRAAEGAP